MKNLIFCGECKFKKRGSCNYSKNITHEFKYDWASKYFIKKEIRSPAEINEKNDCNWYKAKIWIKIREIFGEIMDFVSLIHEQ